MSKYWRVDGHGYWSSASGLSAYSPEHKACAAAEAWCAANLVKGFYRVYFSGNTQKPHIRLTVDPPNVGTNRYV